MGGGGEGGRVGVFGVVAVEGAAFARGRLRVRVGHLVLRGEVWKGADGFGGGVDVGGGGEVGGEAEVGVVA